MAAAAAVEVVVMVARFIECRGGSGGTMLCVEGGFSCFCFVVGVCVYYRIYVYERLRVNAICLYFCEFMRI